MSSALDLEEQEQLDQIKHFWKRWGNLISWALIAVLGAYAAWNGWQAWQNRQASQAAVLFDTVDQAAQRGDMTLLDRSLTDIQDKFGSTTLAHQAALLAGKHVGIATKETESVVGPYLTRLAYQQGRKG